MNIFWMILVTFAICAIIIALLPEPKDRPETAAGKWTSYSRPPLYDGVYHGRGVPKRNPPMVTPEEAAKGISLDFVEKED